MSEKIKPQHLTRKAFLYIRQSSPAQVLHNTESRRLQYAMQERLRHLGWTEIEIIDEDLGRSAAGTVARAGFERLVAEVCLGHAGAVSARELSRFARNSREWQQLIEVCRMVDTLLIDQEMVYDPRLSNDRLLLGLKGSLNEYELDLLRQRAVEARRAKAQRGELVAAVPVGFLRNNDGDIEMDPDQRVQEAIRLVYRKVAEFGSIRQVLLWLLEHGLELPARRCGPSGWETIWKRPRYPRVHAILTNPTYAGAYHYGKTEVTTRYDNGVPTKHYHNRPPEEWLALIPQHHAGYVDWGQFQRIQQMIENNAQGFHETKPGAAKRGPALLSGVLRCGQKMLVTYTGRGHSVVRYLCVRGHLDTAEAKCIQFGGQRADEAVGHELLRVLQPAAVEVAMRAAAEVTREQNDVLAALERDLQAACYVADRAGKQFDAADPANRLVTAELERRWNAALDHVRQIEARIEKLQTTPTQTTAPTTDELKELAADFAKVWDDPDTDVRLKKRLLRALIHEILVDVDAAAGEVVLVVHWQGGVHSELRVPRRRHGQNRLHTAPEIIDTVRVLNRICGDDQIAGVLNRADLRTGRGNRWTRERVAALRQHFRIPAHSPGRQATEGWFNLTEGARLVGVSPGTLRVAMERGNITGEHPLRDGPWVIHRDELTSERAKNVAERAKHRTSGGAKANPDQQTLDFSGK